MNIFNDRHFKCISSELKFENRERVDDKDSTYMRICILKMFILIILWKNCNPIMQTTWILNPLLLAYMKGKFGMRSVFSKIYGLKLNKESVIHIFDKMSILWNYSSLFNINHHTQINWKYMVFGWISQVVARCEIKERRDTLEFVSHSNVEMHLKLSNNICLDQ